MGVTGEKEDLVTEAHLLKEPHRLAGPLMIEIYQNIIQDQGQVPAPLGISLDQGETQGKVELFHGAPTEALHGPVPPTLIDNQEFFTLQGGHDLEVAPCGEEGEIVPRLLKHLGLVFGFKPASTLLQEVAR